MFSYAFYKEDTGVNYGHVRIVLMEFRVNEALKLCFRRLQKFITYYLQS